MIPLYDEEPGSESIGQNDGKIQMAWFEHDQKDTSNQKGWALRIEDNRHYGRCRPFLYLDGEPLCLIGPDCRILFD